jgi:hypothetical protein
MIAYVDASVLLRAALGQPDSLPEWSKIDRGVSSEYSGQDERPFRSKVNADSDEAEQRFRAS